MKDLEALIGFSEAPVEERDYSVIGQFTPEAAMGNCVYITIFATLASAIFETMRGVAYEAHMKRSIVKGNPFEIMEYTSESYQVVGR